MTYVPYYSIILLHKWLWILLNPFLALAPNQNRVCFKISSCSAYSADICGWHLKKSEIYNFLWQFNGIQKPIRVGPDGWQITLWSKLFNGNSLGGDKKFGKPVPRLHQIYNFQPYKHKQPIFKVVASVLLLKYHSWLIYTKKINN